jgi:hypothetical protein
MKLDPRRKRHTPPHFARERIVFKQRRRTQCLGMSALVAIERAPDLVERVPGLLQGFDSAQLIEMFGTVVVPASDAERRREESFLNVVTDRAPRDAATIRQIADRVAGLVGHESRYTTVTVALSTVALIAWRKNCRDPAIIGNGQTAPHSHNELAQCTTCPPSSSSQPI